MEKSYAMSSKKDWIKVWSLKMACRQQGWEGRLEEFRKAVPSLEKQYTQEVKLTPYMEQKIRNQHIFQSTFAAKWIEKLYLNKKTELNVVDIGDSAGNHLRYINSLLKNKFHKINAVSVNLDPVAVGKIRAAGGKAELCRAEDYCPENGVDFFMSFEMVEHLHDPAAFFHHLAQNSDCKYIAITVPYTRKSRVALRNSMNGSKGKITAEKEHIFEFSPEDWKKLILHAGWKAVGEEVYLQYPGNLPVITPCLRYFWEREDFEGFLGLMLKKDMRIANRYQDW